MTAVMHPQDMNPAFAEAFNSGNVQQLLALYEEDAVLCADTTGTQHRGKAAISRVLTDLVAIPGKMESWNNFCLACGDIALLRADYVIRDGHGALLAQGSTAEMVRRQPNGDWLYVADHAAAMALPSVLLG